MDGRAVPVPQQSNGAAHEVCPQAILDVIARNQAWKAGIGYLRDQTNKSARE